MNNKKLIKQLVDKSIEAFIIGLEIYNKPTIKYRIEGFSFFICNAWELMLKAKLIKDYGANSIYYKDKTERTISLENCIKKIYTNENGNLRKNLETIIELRNTSTHFITEEYERIYAPLFQACVQNFVSEISIFHNEDITNYIAQNFLTLSVNIKEIDSNQLRGKYSKEIISKLLEQEKKILGLEENSNSDFYIPINTSFYITKDKSKADFSIYYDKNAKIKANYIKELQDPNKVYPYKTKDIIKLVNKRLKIKNIFITKTSIKGKKQGQFTSNDFQLFVKFYNIKDDSKYTFYSNIWNMYSYSINLVDFIYNEILSRPDTIIEELKKGIKKKITPGA